MRNPSYVAVVAAIGGKGRPVLLVYGLLAGAVMWAFARWYEGPAAARRSGADRPMRI
ncbi:hypothetical protein [Streptomyces sp. NPDC002402]